MLVSTVIAARSLSRVVDYNTKLAIALARRRILRFISYGSDKKAPGVGADDAAVGFLKLTLCLELVDEMATEIVEMRDNLEAKLGRKPLGFD